MRQRGEGDGHQGAAQVHRGGVPDAAQEASGNGGRERGFARAAEKAVPEGQPMEGGE